MGATGMSEVRCSGGAWRHPRKKMSSQHHVVTLLVLLVFWGMGEVVLAMPPSRGRLQPPQFQDPSAGAAASLLPILDEVAIAEIREHLANVEPQEQRLALLYQLIKQYMATGEPPHIPPPLMHSATHQMADAAALVPDDGTSDEEAVVEEENKPKRVSSAYMSLCHFKICNMGRKRNYRYASAGSANPWARV